MFFGIIDILIALALSWVVTAVIDIGFIEAMVVILFADYFYRKGRKFWDKMNDLEKKD